MGDSGYSIQATGAGTPAVASGDAVAGPPPPSEAEILAEAARRRAETAVPDSSDTEAEPGAWPSGSGWRGNGPPMQIPDKRGKPRPFWDGGGPCSPGKWAPEQRHLPGGLIRELGDFMLSKLMGCDPNRIYARAIAQQILESPFPEKIIDETREHVREKLRKAGFDCEALRGDQPQITNHCCS